MPLLGIISDIHGNLEALQAVLGALEADGAERLIHLGDLVGYNANPRECVRLVAERNALCILGNHDLAVLEPQAAQSFNVLAYEALHYAHGQLTPPERRYLQSLPRTLVLWDRYLLCHGSPENIETYILDGFQARRIFNLLRKRYEGIRICFFGHTHIPRLWVSDPRGKVSSPAAVSATVPLDTEHMYLINPGSVGQPRQRDNQARYLLFDTDRGVVHFRAVAYDVATAQRKILEAALPEYLALRLADGI